MSSGALVRRLSWTPVRRLGLVKPHTAAFKNGANGPPNRVSLLISYYLSILYIFLTESFLIRRALEKVVDRPHQQSR